jgi:hypothetical protein
LHSAGSSPGTRVHCTVTSLLEEDVTLAYHFVPSEVAPFSRGGDIAERDALLSSLCSSFMFVPVIARRRYLQKMAGVQMKDAVRMIMPHIERLFDVLMDCFWCSFVQGR